MPTPALTARGLLKRYQGRAVVDGVDLDLVPGEITALLGPSGSGKSTVLRLLAGLEGVDAGSIQMGDTPLSRPKQTVPPERRDIGLMFQEHALFPHKTVLGNVTYGLNHLARAEARQRAMDLLELMQLADRIRDWPAALSGGEQQRVALARALARRPAVLLMDEPFSSLDASLRAEVRESLTPTLRAAGAAVLLVTHDAEDALQMADQLVLMDQGQVIQQGRPDDVYRQPASRKAAQMLGPICVLPVSIEGGTAVTALGRYALPDGLAGAEAVQLLARPAAIRLTDPPPQGVPAQVVSCHRAGAWTGVTVRIGEQTVTLHHSGPAPETGETVHVSLDARDAVLVRA